MTNEASVKLPALSVARNAPVCTVPTSLQSNVLVVVISYVSSESQLSELPFSIMAVVIVTCPLPTLTVILFTATVGSEVSITIALLAPRDPDSPGAANVNVAEVSMLLRIGERSGIQ